MPISEKLLEILVCPEDKTSVSLADDQLIQSINQKIEAGDICNKKGEVVKDKLQSGLIREDQKRLYPVRDDIPIMIIEESIEL